MDMGNPGIIKELKLLEGNDSMPHPVRPNEEILIQFDLDEVLWTEINGNRVSLQLEDFEAVLDTDATPGELRKAFKLSRDHLGKLLTWRMSNIDTLNVKKLHFLEMDFIDPHTNPIWKITDFFSYPFPLYFIFSILKASLRLCDESPAESTSSNRTSLCNCSKSFP